MIEGLTYAGLGAAALGLAGWVLTALAKRSNVRAKSEGDLDSRVVAMVGMVTKPLNEIIEEERAEKRRAQDRAEAVTLKLIELTTTITERHAQEIRQIREEARQSTEKMAADSKAAMEIAYARIDECEKSHRLDATALARVQLELKELRDREYARALATPVPAPVLLATPAPA